MTPETHAALIAATLKKIVDHSSHSDRAVVSVPLLMDAIAVIQTAGARETWQPIETAPTDGTLFLCWAPSREGLPPMFSLCAWHPDGGFCIDELRVPTHWQPLVPPVPPKEE